MRGVFALTVIIVLLLALVIPTAAEEAEFTLGRFVTCQRIVDREPVGITETFPDDTVKVYAFIEALDIAKETGIKIEWLFEDKQAAIIELTLGQSKRWRTYSSKRIGIRHGNWEVRLLDSQDNLLRSLAFTVK